MKISGFTIARNIVKYNYPAIEAIFSILPVCDEFIINVGESEDETLQLLKTIPSSKIKIINRKWDDSLGKEMLSAETNFALSQCRGDWAFYLQIDEVVHERDLQRLKKYMLKYFNHNDVDGFRLRWLHFYGSFYRYRIDAPWFQKQTRIIRNNGTVESYEDAWGFKRKDNAPLRVIKTPCFIYHYGWVNRSEVMSLRRKNAENLGYANLNDNEKKSEYSFGNFNRFPVYFGTHPQVMNEIVKTHPQSIEDKKYINKRYFWSPFLWSRLRYKTFKRVKQSIPV